MKQIAIMLLMLIPSLAITHSIGIGGSRDIDAVHKWELWDSELNVSTITRSPNILSGNTEFSPELIGAGIESLLTGIVSISNNSQIPLTAVSYATNDSSNPATMILSYGEHYGGGGSNVFSVYRLCNLTQTGFCNSGGLAGFGDLSNTLFPNEAVDIFSDVPGSYQVMRINGYFLDPGSKVLYIANTDNSKAIEVDDSTQVCSNLNADLLDSYHAADIIALIPAPVTSLPAENITAGTFGSGDYVFPANLNVTGDLVVIGNITGGSPAKFKEGIISYDNITSYMNISAQEFIADIDVYTPTIIGTKSGDTVHLAINSDVIIDNQDGVLPSTIQIKSDRDSGLTLQDNIVNQSIITYGGNLILAPDAGYLEVIPAVNDTNFGSAEHPWNEGRFNHLYGDGSNLTGLPTGGDFNDTGLLYQNGTRNLSADWDAGDVNISITPGIGVTEYPGRFFAVDGLYSGLLIANDTNRTNGVTLTMNTAPSNGAVYPEINPINKNDKTIFVIKSSQDSNRTGQGYPAIMMEGAYDGSDYAFIMQDSNKTMRLFSNNGNMSLQAFGDSPNGNVGIGTITPNYKLDVNGTVNANYFKGDGSQLTGLPAFSDTGLLYQNGTRPLTGDLNASSYKIKFDTPYGSPTNGIYFNNSAFGESFIINSAGTELYLQSADSRIYLNDEVYIAGALLTNSHQPNAAATYDLGTSLKYWNRTYSNEFYGKNTSIFSFDDYEDTELVRNIMPIVGNEKSFEMPIVLFDKFNDTIEKEIIDKGITTKVNTTIETESLNIGKVIGLAYGTLKEIIQKNDDQQSEIAWLTLENQKFKDQIDNICKMNGLRGCT